MLMAMPKDALVCKLDGLKAKEKILQARISRLNNENFGLRTENDRLKASLNTHAEQVLSEHNYA